MCVSGVLLAISQRQLYSEQGRHSCHNDQQSILSWLSPPPKLIDTLLELECWRFEEIICYFQFQIIFHFTASDHKQNLFNIPEILPRLACISSPPG